MTMTRAAGRIEDSKCSSLDGSGALRETVTASARTISSHTMPAPMVVGTTARKPTLGVASKSSPNWSASEFPVLIVKVCRAANTTGIRASSQSTAVRAKRPSSSPPDRTAWNRSGRTKKAAATSAPTRLTDSGTTLMAASDWAMTPAPPLSSIRPPTAMTTVAATTGGNAEPGSCEAPASHRPRAATTVMASRAARTTATASSQPRRTPGAVAGAVVSWLTGSG